MTKSPLGSQGYGKVAIGNGLATMVPIQLEHELGPALFDDAFGSQNAWPRAQGRAQGYVKVAIRYRLATLFPSKLYHQLGPDFLTRFLKFKKRGQEPKGGPKAMLKLQ